MRALAAAAFAAVVAANGLRLVAARKRARRTDESCWAAFARSRRRGDEVLGVAASDWSWTLAAIALGAIVLEPTVR